MVCLTRLQALASKSSPHRIEPGTFLGQFGNRDTGSGVVVESHDSIFVAIAC